jgi:UDP-glucose 4-epimerase
MSIRVLISGGTGYIGTILSHYLHEYKIDFAVIDNLSNSSLKFFGKKFIFYKGNINNLLILEKIYQKFRPTHIIHLAASIDVNESEIKKKKYYNNNVLSSRKFINFFVKKNIKNFIFASTAAVYNSNPNKKLEKNKETPSNYYGYTKLSIEKFLLKKKRENKLNIKILRFFNVVGADKKFRSGNISRSSKHLFNNLSKSIFYKKFFKINGKNYNTIDGTCIRDFVDINDLVEIIIFFLKTKNSQTIFNIGTNKGYTVLEVLKYFEKNLRIKIKYKYFKNRFGDAPNLVCDNNLLRRVYKSKFVDFNKSIKNHYFFYKKNFNYFV